MNIDVKEIDRLRMFLTEEERYCRGRSEGWAQSKADKLSRVGEILLELRREKQMTGVGGTRIQDNG